jgi:hypothetical protein
MKAWQAAYYSIYECALTGGNYQIQGLAFCITGWRRNPTCVILFVDRCAVD